MRKRLGIVLVVVALVVAACGDDDSGDSAPTTAAPTSTAASAADGSTVTTDPAAVVAVGPDGGAARSGSLVLLADDFQDRNADGWDIDYGWYLFGSGMDVGMAASQSAWMWWPEGEEWDTGYVLRASVRVDEGGLAVAAAVGPDGRYVVHLHEDGTDVLIDRPWGTFETLATAAPVTLGDWHSLAIGVQDDLVHVYVDGEPLIAAAADLPLEAGSIGFGALDGSFVAFDNVYVTVLRGQLPSLALSVPPGPAAVAAPEVEEPPDDAGGEEPPGDGLPNLQAVFVWFEQVNVVAGESIDVGINVMNTGAAPAGPFEVAWEAMGSACTAAIAGLDPMEQAGGTCTAPALPAGLHTWTAHVDHDERVVESNESGHVLTGHLEVTPGAPNRPDLTLIDGNIPNATNGEPMEIWVIVSDVNVVGLEGSSYTTRFLLDGQLICSVDSAGTSSQPRCSVPAMAEGDHILEVIVDAENEIFETREDNNGVTVQIVVSLD